MGRWLKTRFLGRGSYGTVHQAINISAAEQRDYPRPIAIKSSTLSTSYSLQKEEHVLNSFMFVPEIVQSHGSEITQEDDGQWVYNLLLEWAPYGTLADMIKKGPFLETKATKVYISMLLRGLSCIHQKGFVHCDFKPENILVFPPHRFQDPRYFQLKVADFGLARTPEEKVNQEYWKSRFRGTPIFMSPESLSCGQIEAPLDIWSFGCMVIEMITGHPAWGEEMLTKDDILLKVGLLKEAPKMPRGLSTGCMDFLNKCLAQDPNQRWTANMLLNHPYLIV